MTLLVSHIVMKEFWLTILYIITLVRWGSRPFLQCSCQMWHCALWPNLSTLDSSIQTLFLKFCPQIQLRCHVLFREKNLSPAQTNYILQYVANCNMLVEAHGVWEATHIISTFSHVNNFSHWIMELFANGATFASLPVLMSFLLGIVLTYPSAPDQIATNVSVIEELTVTDDKTNQLHWICSTWLRVILLILWKQRFTHCFRILVQFLLN